MEVAPTTSKVPVEAKREEVSTPLISITKYLETNFGKPIKRSVLLETGVSNEVYEMTNEDGEEFICRIAKNKPHNRFGEEKWALDRARDVGAPVPQVLTITREEINGATYDICLESKIPGKALYEIHDLSKEERSGLLASTGEVLSMIHSIPVNGFGKFDTEGKGEFSSIQEILHDPYIEKEELLKIAQELGLNIDTIKKAYDIMGSGSASYPETHPSLIHGDFTPKHILVDNKKVTGVIDFENAMGGDPVMDLAHWHFFFKDQLNVEEIIKGYKKKEDISTDFDRIFNLWRVYFGLMHLKFQYQKKNQVGIDFAQRQITDDVNYFNSHLRKPENSPEPTPTMSVADATVEATTGIEEPVLKEDGDETISIQLIEEAFSDILAPDETIKSIAKIEVTNANDKIFITGQLMARSNEDGTPRTGEVNIELELFNAKGVVAFRSKKIEAGATMTIPVKKIQEKLNKLIEALKLKLEKHTNKKVKQMEIKDGKIKVIFDTEELNTKSTKARQLKQITDKILKMLKG